MLEQTILKLRFANIIRINKILQDILNEICSEKNFVIIANPMNEMSLDLIYEGAMPKNHSITLRTEKKGVLGGYILIDGELNLPSKLIRREVGDAEAIFFREKNGIKAETTYSDKRSYMRAFTNSQGNFITSDLDLLMICGKGSLSMDSMDESYEMGSILRYEYDLCKLVNKIFTQRIRRENSHFSTSIIPLISHGPFNRYRGSKLEDIYFPLTIYHPTKGRFLLGSETNREKSINEFLYLCETFRSQGYLVDVNQNWVI